MGIETKLKLRLGISLVDVNMDSALAKLEPIEDAEPEACLYTGRIYLSRGDYATALKKINTYIQRIGENEAAAYYLGCALAGSNLKRRRPDYDSAIEAFERVLGARGRFALRAHLQLGKIYQSLDQREAAREHYQACSGHADTRLEASLGLAYLYFSSGNVGEARAMLASLQKSHAGDPRLSGLAGMAAELEGDYPAAEQAYAQANDPAALGVVLYRQGLGDDALKNLEKARAAGDTSDRTLYFCGLIYAETGKLAAALDVWQSLYKRHPEDETLGWNIARLWYRLGSEQLDRQEDEQAAESWEHYYRHASTDPTFVTILAQLYLRIAARNITLPASKPALQRARELGLPEPDSLLADGLSLLSENDLYNGAAKLEQYLVSRPEDAVTHYNAGVALAKIGQKAAARSHFQQAYSTGQTGVRVPAGWAAAEISAVEEDWPAVLQFAPTDSEMTPRRSLILLAALLKTGQTEQAVAEAARGCSAESHLFLAASFAASGQEDLAVQQYEMALQLDPQADAARQGAAAIYTGRAVAAARHEDWAQAQANLDRALALTPGLDYLIRLQKVVRQASGSNLLDTSQLETVIDELEKVQQMDPCRADVAHQLAILHHRRAIYLEENAEPQEQARAWNHAFANWAVALLSDEYWAKWSDDRQMVYELEVKPEEVEKLRTEIVRGRIRELHNQYMQLYYNEGKPEEVSRHRRFAAQWSLEWNAARSVRDTVRFLIRKGMQPRAVVAGGPIFWEKYGMRTAVTQIAADALRMDANFQPALFIRQALSPVGLAKTLLEEAQVDECIHLLEEYLHTNPSDASARDLIARAYMAKLRAQAGSDPRGAIATAEKARQYGANLVEAEEMIYLAAMETVAAAEKSGRFDEAEQVISDVLQIMPNRQPLKEKQIEIFCARVDQLLTSSQAEADQNGDLDAIIEKLLAAKQSLEALNPASVPLMRRVQGILDRLNDLGKRLCVLRAGQLDFQATALIRKGYAEAQAGNRVQARQTFQEARAILDRALQLDNDNPNLHKNLKVVNDQLARLG